MKGDNKMNTGWYGNQYFVVKPLENGHQQMLLVGAQPIGFGRWWILLGVFPSDITYDAMWGSYVWIDPTSTNKNPSANTLALALGALNEVEQEIHKRANGKKAYIYVDGLDKRRLRVYTKVLTKRCGYKVSTAWSDHVKNAHVLYKRV